MLKHPYLTVLIVALAGLTWVSVLPLPSLISKDTTGEHGNGAQGEPETLPDLVIAAR